MSLNFGEDQSRRLAVDFHLLTQTTNLSVVSFLIIILTYSTSTFMACVPCHATLYCPHCERGARDVQIYVTLCCATSWQWTMITKHPTLKAKNAKKSAEFSKSILNQSAPKIHGEKDKDPKIDVSNFCKHFPNIWGLLQAPSLRDGNGTSERRYVKHASVVWPRCLT